MRLLFLMPKSGSRLLGLDPFLAALGDAHELSIFDGSHLFAEQLRGIDVVIDNRGADRAMIDAAADQRIQLWQILSTGLDSWDIPYFLEKGVSIAYTPGQFSGPALAEHALFLILALVKNLNRSQANLAAGIRLDPMNTELAGKTLGLVGLGASGRETAWRAAALGMEIAAIDVLPIDDEARSRFGIGWFGGVDSLLELMARSDVVSIHAPLTPQTTGLIGRSAIRAMRPGSIIVNVARGAIIDEVELLAALEDGHLAGAGLDVFVDEPADPRNPLVTHSRVVATPHVAGITHETMMRRGMAAVQNIERVARGETPLFLVTAAG
jgi:phosphoglycerate dehydrogenase-like enzyme